MTDSTDVDVGVDQRRSYFRGLYRALRGRGLWIDARVTDGLLEFFVPETIYVEMRATPPLEELPIEASEAQP